MSLYSLIFKVILGVFTLSLLKYMIEFYLRKDWFLRMYL